MDSSFLTFSFTLNLKGTKWARTISFKIGNAIFIKFMYAVHIHTHFVSMSYQNCVPNSYTQFVLNPYTQFVSKSYQIRIHNSYQNRIKFVSNSYRNQTIRIQFVSLVWLYEFNRITPFPVYDSIHINSYKSYTIIWRRSLTQALKVQYHHF